MSASIPLVRISVRCSHNLIVELTAHKKKLRVSTRLSPEKLTEYRTTFYKGLEKFRKRIGKRLDMRERIDPISEAMLQLHEIGCQLNFDLFGTRRYEVEDFLKIACPTWKESGSENYLPPLVQITNRIEHSLPLEFLPLFDTETPPRIHNVKDLSCVAARFLGFSTIVSRVFLRHSKKKRSDAVLENRDGLAVRFFQHAGLTGAKTERVFFEGTNWIHLRELWPDKSVDKDQFVSELATRLWNASTISIGSTPQSLDQIHHFACHCDTEGKSPDYSIYLAHKAGLFANHFVRRATLGALAAKFGNYPKRELEASYPLVFLNACKASKLTAAGVTSFPDLFLEIGNRGVIGTESSVPDKFAAAFSGLFYSNLYWGHNLGEALYRARWCLLNCLGNPLGILYTFYADPDLRLRRRRPRASCADVFDLLFNKKCRGKVDIGHSGSRL
jgi:hypothetical protein